MQGTAAAAHVGVGLVVALVLPQLAWVSDRSAGARGAGAFPGYPLVFEGGGFRGGRAGR